MMENSALNNLKIGDQLVEIQAGTLHNMEVFEVTLYKCISFLGFRKIKTYTFPFYFISVALVKKFLKYYNYFKIIDDHTGYYGPHCFSLKVNEISSHMVDAYKSAFNDSSFKTCALTYNGIWGGDVNNDNDMYPSDMKNNYDFIKLIDMCNIPIKNKKKIYQFKMIENS